jgi:hypothetical protein
LGDNWFIYTELGAHCLALLLIDILRVEDNSADIAGNSTDRYEHHHADNEQHK